MARPEINDVAAWTPETRGPDATSARLLDTSARAPRGPSSGRRAAPVTPARTDSIMRVGATATRGGERSAVTCSDGTSGAQQSGGPESVGTTFQMRPGDCGKRVHGCRTVKSKLVSSNRCSCRAPRTCPRAPCGSTNLSLTASAPRRSKVDEFVSGCDGRGEAGEAARALGEKQQETSNCGAARPWSGPRSTTPRRRRVEEVSRRVRAMLRDLDGTRAPSDERLELCERARRPRARGYPDTLWRRVRAPECAAFCAIRPVRRVV